MVPSRAEGNDGVMASQSAAIDPLRRPLAWFLRYGSMVREIAVTDFKLKYQGSVLGYVWSVAKPLLMFAILLFVFTRLFRINARVDHYAQYLLLGIVLWSYFVDATVVAMVSVVDRMDLIRKVYFPRIVIPIAASVSSLITLVLNLCIVAVFIGVARITPQLSSPLFLLLLLELYVFSLGCSLLLAALYVRFRDFRHIWEVLLQLLFYLSPIIYPLTFAGRFAPVMALSPIAQIVEDSRKLLIDPVNTRTVTDILPWPFAAVPYLIPVLLVILGYWYFEASAARFAEEL